MVTEFKLFKDGKTKIVKSWEEAEELIAEGWTLIDNAQSYQIGFSRDGIVKLAMPVAFQRFKIPSILYLLLS